MKKEKAITLISLVITIIVLIILASVGIYLSLGNNGIFTRANEAKEATNKQTATEIINLKITNCQINKYAEEQRMPTLKELSVVLGVDNDIQYVTEKSQIASTKYEVGENPTSIYTKLNDYPYEFEINGQLQLASINGIKLSMEESKVLGIDTNNVLTTYTRDWGTTDDFEYTAIQDCYILGYIGVSESGRYDIYLNDVIIGRVFSASTRTIFPINYVIKKGDKIKLQSIIGSGALEINVFAIK